MVNLRRAQFGALRGEYMSHAMPRWRWAPDTIRLGMPGDVRYWTGLWGLTDRELADAVAAVGPMAADVAAHLGKPLQGEDLGDNPQPPRRPGRQSRGRSGN